VYLNGRRLDAKNWVCCEKGGSPVVHTHDHKNKWNDIPIMTPTTDEDDRSISNSTSRSVLDDTSNFPTNVTNTNRVSDVSEVSTVTTGSKGDRISLDRGQRRRVALYLKEEGWKKHKFAMRGHKKAHLLFTINKHLLEDMYDKCNIGVNQLCMRAQLKEPLMTAFEAGLATTRSNKIQAIKTKYFGKYKLAMH
jgi:hypothetical protein